MLEVLVWLLPLDIFADAPRPTLDFWGDARLSQAGSSGSRESPSLESNRMIPNPGSRIVGEGPLLGRDRDGYIQSEKGLR